MTFLATYAYFHIMYILEIIYTGKPPPKRLNFSMKIKMKCHTMKANNPYDHNKGRNSSFF
jgi:hypothetical protein